MHPTTINDYDYEKKKKNREHAHHTLASQEHLAKKRNQAVPGLTAMDWVPFPKTPMPTHTFPSANAVAVDFLFFGTSLPQRGGRGGVGARAATAAKISSSSSISSSSAPGAKRDKYRNDTE
jgi:hypothetical protein